MDMVAVLEQMVPTTPQTPPTPRTPDEREGTALEEAPDVKMERNERNVQKRGSKRCLAEALGGDGGFGRAPSPEPEVPGLVLPRSVMLGSGERAAEDKGKGPSDEAPVETRPSKTLRMQARPTKKASMDGGSSVHNQKLQRQLSVCVAREREARERERMQSGPSSPLPDPEVLFAESNLTELRSPTQARMEVERELSPTMKQLRLFDRFEEATEFEWAGLDAQAQV
jgi:hypothetical protein